jgi:hypothetical protein
LSGALSPYQAELGRGFGAGLQAARTASGGQSSIYGAMAQGLYNRRMQAAEQLPAQAAQLRAQGMSNMGNMAQMKTDYDRSRAYFNQQQYDRSRREYQYEAELAGGLEAAGRENLGGALNSAIPQLGAALSPLFLKRSALPETAEMEQRLNSSPSLLRRYSPLSRYTGPAYGMMAPRYNTSAFNVSLPKYHLWQ